MKIILIAGPSGSGKTTISNKLAEHYGADKCQVFSLDPYYRDQSGINVELRDQVNYDNPENVELELAVRHLAALKAGQTIFAPVYDFKTHSRSKEIREIKPTDILIVEGIFALQPELSSLGELSVYIDTDLDLCLLRRIERDVKERGRTVESVIAQYKATVRPMRIEHIESGKQFADLVIVDNSSNFHIDISPITEKVDELDQDDLVVLTAGVESIKTSVTGWYSWMTNSLVKKMEAIDHAANTYLAEDEHPEASKKLS